MESPYYKILVEPVKAQVAQWQEGERKRLGCRLDANESDGSAEKVLAQKVEAFDGQTLECVIKSLLKSDDMRKASAEIEALRSRVAKLEKRQKLLNWCAKRIRRLMRVRHQNHKEKQKEKHDDD